MDYLKWHLDRNPIYRLQYIVEIQYVALRRSVLMATKKPVYGNESITALKGADRVRKRPGVQLISVGTTVPSARTLSKHPVSSLGT